MSHLSPGQTTDCLCQQYHCPNPQRTRLSWQASNQEQPGSGKTLGTHDMLSIKGTEEGPNSSGLPTTTCLISLIRETGLELVSEDTEEQNKEQNKAPLKSEVVEKRQTNHWTGQAVAREVLEDPRLKEIWERISPSLPLTPSAPLSKGEDLLG